MLRSKKYRTILLLIKLGDVILDTKLAKKYEEKYRQYNKTGKIDKENKEIVMSKYKMANEVSGIGKTEVLSNNSELKRVFNIKQSTKGEDMRDLHKERSNSKVGEHFDNFTQWANDRQIIKNGNILAQGLKLVSEVGELADNLAKGRCTKDDIGDCCVVLNNLAQMQGLTLNECLEQAWLDIKDRKGYMNEHGVFIKESDIEK